MRAALEKVREQLDSDGRAVSCLKDTVTEFDSAARAIAKCLARMVKMKLGRKVDLERNLFHNVKRRAEELRQWFDIDIFKGMKPEDVSSVIKMFARRHVYEHNGGEVDKRYIEETGDTSVKVKQLIRETRESVLATVLAVDKMMVNLHGQFHEIFQPEQMPISYHRPKRKMHPGSKAPLS